MGEYSFLQIEAFANRFYQGRPLWITPYGYPVRFAALAPNVPTTQTINIAANADFILLSLNAKASIAAPATPITVSSMILPLVRALLTDAGSGENFTNGTVDLKNYASIWYVNNIPYPRVLTGKTAVSVQVTNYGTDTYDNLELYLSGVQVRAMQ